MADEDFGIDPAIAEAMGFSGFGMQPGKKRKFDTNDGFIDPSLAKDTTTTKSHGKGANSHPLGKKMADRTNASSEVGSAVPLVSAIETEARLATRHLEPHQASLEALRHGVQNQRGDMVYFRPGFLEDPWERLRLRK